MSCRKRTFRALFALASLAAFPVLGADGGRFSVAVGTQDNLLITGPGGEQVADMVAPTLQKGVTVGNTTFQVSYGRDASGQLTAVLTPPDSSAVTLHFSAGGRSIDVEKAVVTLTFSPNLKGVLIDPGYVGTVEVDSHLLRARSLTDDQPAPADLSSAQTVTADATSVPSPVAAVASEPAPSIPEPASVPAVATTSAFAPSPAPASPAPAAVPAPSAPPLLASQLTPLLAPSSPAASNAPPPPATPSSYQSIHDTLAASAAPVTSPKPEAAKPLKLFWSEPVTAPDGTAPAIALDEIKLVELRGTVTVVPPDGQIQPGIEGMVVPSGSTVRTADKSSVALFLGGVNSARMMPNCELAVTQALAGSVRTDVINLRLGAVFSRIGHRDGETENYSVSTPEGTSDAETRDMLAYRGNPAELRSTMSMTRSGLALDSRNLLAWNPAPSHGLISDVAQSDLGIITPIGFIPDTYFYYTGGYKLSVNANLVKSEVLANFTSNATTSDTEPDYVLQAILLTLQPYNVKLIKLLNDINNGTETSAQLTYYHNLVTIFFDKQAPGVVNNILNHPNGFAHVLNVDSAMLWQDLREFELPSATPM